MPAKNMWIHVGMLIIASFLIANVFSSSSKSIDDISPTTKTKMKEEFDWRAYIELYPDLVKSLSTKEESIFHYVSSGSKEERVFPKILPEQPGLQTAHKKLISFVKSLDSRNVKMENRTMIVYNVDFGDEFSSYEVMTNNFRIFLSAVSLDSSPNSNNFYWFNVLGDHNKFFGHLNNFQQQYLNVAVVERTIAPHDIFVFVRTLGLVKHILESKFGSVMLLSNGARGPFHDRKNGLWLQPFHKLLFQNNVGLVGATLSCEISTHVQTHAFIIRTQLVNTIISEYNNFKKAENDNWKQERYELGFTKIIQSAGYNISALLYANRMQKPFFDNNCLPGLKQFLDIPEILNPLRWCDIKTEEIAFFRWGGEILRIPESLVCDKTIQYMQQQLMVLNEESPEANLLVPEVMKGGKLFDLYKSYNDESLRDYVTHKENSTTDFASLNNKVCFFMRTAQMHDLADPLGNKNLTTIPITDIVADTGIQDIIKSLIRQTDPNWEAIFFITDEKDFENRLRQILIDSQDPRIKYFFVPLEFRPKYTSLDAGYTPTDYVLREYLTNHRTDCKWFSTSNSDNVYGSQVVENVRNFQTMRKDKTKKTPDMILSPIDSRNFAEQDYQFRKSKHRWTEYCQGIISMLTLNELAYTVQPRPEVGKVDLAGAFLSTEKFLAEGLFFSNFTNKKKFPCIGCQDGYLTEFLVTQRFWTYERLPIDGLRSIIFHGPSPTWCIASGNIWFDHPKSNQVRCYAPYVMRALRKVDSIRQAIFDWEHYEHHDRLCLRFSNLGFLKYTESVSHPKAKSAHHHRLLSLDNLLEI